MHLKFHAQTNYGKYQTTHVISQHKKGVTTSCVHDHTPSWGYHSASAG